MEIRFINNSYAGRVNQNLPASEAGSSSSITPDPRETRQNDSTTPAPSLMKNMSQVLTAHGINKSSVDYRMSTSITSSDGTMYFSYLSTQNLQNDKSTGYLAAVSPDGSILWERASDHEGPSILNAGEDGTVYLRSTKHITALNPDGTLKFEHQFSSPVKAKQIVDAKGNSYFQKSDSKELYIVNAKGQQVELPEGLKRRSMFPDTPDINHGSDCVQVSDNELYIRNGNHFELCDLAKGEITREFEFICPRDPTGKTVRSVSRFTVDNKGAVNVYMNSLPAYDGNPVRVVCQGAAGSPSSFQKPNPALARNSPFMSMEGVVVESGGIENLSIARVDSNGRTISVNCFDGLITSSAELGDGSFLYTMEEKRTPGKLASGMTLTIGAEQDELPRKESRTFIGKVGPDGKRNDLFVRVDGRVTAILPSPEGDFFYVQHGRNSLSQFTSNGKLLNTASIPQDGNDYIPLNALSDDRFIMMSMEKGCAFLYDMNSGAVTPLTDRERDHTSKVLESEIKRSENGKAADLSVTEYDDLIDVGGIQLARRRA
ncbi:MAG: hypothetical protein AB2L14_21495 [Candidatus Xenobiia bacterium LiM19]